MANNYPYKIVRTGDRVETMYDKFYVVQFIIVKQKRVHEAVVEDLEAVIVEVDGCARTIKRELIRKVHTVEYKRCQTNKKNQKQQQTIPA